MTWMPTVVASLTGSAAKVRYSGAARLLAMTAASA
jgi:hypothetical protein